MYFKIHQIIVLRYPLFIGIGAESPAIEPYLLRKIEMPILSLSMNDAYLNNKPTSIKSANKDLYNT